MVPPLDEPPLEDPPPDEPPLEDPPLDEPPLEDPPLDDPPSGNPPSGGGLHGPHVPPVEPMGTTHVSPAQQSALTVHAPHLGTHAPPPP